MKAHYPKSKVLPYQNPAFSAAKRLKDLMSRMTLEEKAAQMVCVWRQKAEMLVDGDGNFDLQKATTAFKKGHAPGQVGQFDGLAERQVATAVVAIRLVGERVDHDRQAPRTLLLELANHDDPSAGGRRPVDVARAVARPVLANAEVLGSRSASIVRPRGSFDVRRRTEERQRPEGNDGREHDGPARHGQPSSSLHSTIFM